MNEPVKKSILLIDDDPLVLKTLGKLLEKAGYLVRAFQDPREAIQDAAMEDFDLVITDIRMPHIDGFEAIRYIREVRSEKSRPDVPEIFITGYSKDYEQETAGMKPHAVIFKPFDLNEFLKVVNDALNG